VAPIVGQTEFGLQGRRAGEGETGFVFNGSVFAEVSASLTLGLELNFRVIYVF